MASELEDSAFLVLTGLADRIENTLSDVCEKFGQSRCLLRLGGQGEVASNSRLLEVGCILIGQHVTIHSSRINPATLRKVSSHNSLM